MNYAKAPMVEITDEDGDALRLEDYVGAPVGHITTSPNGMYLDRERAVTLIEALTARVEALDAAEAAKAAAKFKRGDVVIGRSSGMSYTVIQDEDARGWLVLVNHRTGAIKDNGHAHGYRRP